MWFLLTFIIIIILLTAGIILIITHIEISMDYNELNRQYSDKPQSIQEKLNNLTEIEKKHLYHLFDCKEQVDQEILALKVCEQTETELYKELEKTNEDLLYQFYTKYCTNTISKEELKTLIMNDLWKKGNIDLWITLENYRRIDEEVRISFSRIIFESIDKKDIHLLLENNIKENENFMKLIPKCIEKFMEYLFNYIVNIFSKESIDEIIPIIKWSPSLNKIEQENDWLKDFIYENKNYLTSNDIITRFLAYWKYEDKIWDSVKKYLSEQSSLNFDSIVYSIVFWILENLNNLDILDEYLNFFINKRDYFETFDANQKEYISFLYENAKNLFFNSFWEFENESNSFECEENNIYNVDFGNIMDNSRNDFAIFINKNVNNLLNINEWMKFNEIVHKNDINLVFNYIDNLYTQNKFKAKMFSLRKEYFLNKTSKIALNSSFLEATPEEKEEIFNNLSKKYWKAKSDARFITAKKYWEIKKDFIAQKINKIKEKVLSTINKDLELYKRLKLWELFFISNMYVQFLTDVVKNNIREKYIEYLQNYFEERFKESHDKTEKKEFKKEQAKKQAEQQKQGQTKKVKREQAKQQTEGGQEKKKSNLTELPKWLIPALEKYFWWTINPKIIKSLTKRPWTYKKWHFTRFNVDEEFYRILDDYWLKCEDKVDCNNEWDTKNAWTPINPWETNQEEIQKINEDADNKKILNDKLSFIKSQIKEKKIFDDEIFKLYIDLFKSIGYEIENENNIKDGLLEIRSNIAQLNILLYKLINWWKIWRDKIWWWIKSNNFQKNYKIAYILKFWGTLWKFIVWEEWDKKYLICITKHGSTYDDKFSVD